MERRVAEAARGEAQVPEGWLDDKFVPLGFEADGAWAFEEVVAVYAEIRDPAQLSGHLAVNFGAHWRKAIGAALAGGQAAVCLSGICTCVIPNKRRRHGAIPSLFLATSRRELELIILFDLCDAHMYIITPYYTIHVHVAYYYAPYYYNRGIIY